MEELKQPMQQAGDKHLMQEFTESHTVDNKGLEKIKYCRMYLKVEHVTDIATSDGKRIHPQLLEKPGRRLNNQKHTVEWPRQQQPNQQSWHLFYAALRAMVMMDTGQLKKPLGHWIRRYKFWTTCYEEKTNTVFAYKECWYQHEIVRKTELILEFQQEGNSKQSTKRSNSTH
eukprot:8934374-Ditylum_brightwellii.AAC.2